MNNNLDKELAEFIGTIQKAIQIAEEKQIKNNIVVLNEEYDELKEFYFSVAPRPIANSVRHYHPTLLGKKLLLAKLPKKYFYAIGWKENCLSKDEYIAKLESENAELKEKMAQLEEQINGWRD